MAYNDFIKFATNHRILLETAIKKYPTALKPSDLVEFDQIMLETKKELRSHGLLETWKPIATFKSPEDFLYVRENELILEAIDKKITDDRKINPATRTQITAVENLRTWFDKLPPDIKIQVDKFAQTWSPSKNKFEPELDAIEEVINSMYGHGKEGGTVKKLAKNFGGWLTRGMSKLTGAGKVSDAGADLNEQIANQKMIADLYYTNQPLENIMISELFGQQMVNEIAPGISFPGFSSAQAAFDAGRVIAPHAQHGLSHAAMLAKKAALLKIQAAQAAAVAAKTGAAGAAGVPSAGGAVSMTALKAGGGKGAAASMTALKAGGAKAAVAGGVSSVGAGLMVGGVLLAGAAVYAGWSARDSRKRIESLMAIARQMKTIGTPPPPPPPPEGDPTLLPPPEGDPPPPPPPRGDIYVFRGKGGRGFQSRAARLLNTLSLAPDEYKAAQRASSAVLNAMAKDLKRAGFNVLEEGKLGLKLKNTREALVGLSPDVRGVVLNLLGTFARENGFTIKGSLGRDLGSPPPLPSETPLNREQKLVIRTYMADKAGDPDFDTVESIKRVTKVAGPTGDEAKQALKDVGLMESYSYLHSNNLMSDKQFYSRDLRMNKGLIRESIITRK